MRGRHFTRRNDYNTANGLPKGTKVKNRPRRGVEPRINSEVEAHSVWTLTELTTLTTSALYNAGLETIGDVCEWLRDTKRKRIKGIGPATITNRITPAVNKAVAGQRGTTVLAMAS